MLDKADSFLDRRLDRHLACIQNDRIPGLNERCQGPVAIAFVSRLQVAQHFVVMRRHSTLEKLANAALCPDFGRRRDEQLGIGAWSDNCADIASIENRPARLSREVFLPLQERRTNRRIG